MHLKATKRYIGVLHVDAAICPPLVFVFVIDKSGYAVGGAIAAFDWFEALLVKPRSV